MDATASVEKPTSPIPRAPSTYSGSARPSRRITINPAASTEVTSANRRTIWAVSSGRALGRGVYALSGVLYDATGERVIEVADLTRARSLPGRHNWQNAAAAYAAARALGVSIRDAAEGLMSFPGLAHRMETVARLGRVRFVNDSKATNADSAERALASYDRVVWIAGGMAKAGGIESLRPVLPRIARAFLIGRDAPLLAATLTDAGVPYEVSGTLEAAVPAAAAAARAGAAPVVLLSPACASWDQFSGFDARGDAFRALVRSLAPIGRAA